MRASATFVLLFALLLPGRGWAADPAAQSPSFALPEVTAASKFSEAQIAYVQSWISAKAPECPVNLAAAVARHFLEELQAEHPEKLDRLLSADFPAGDFESALLRQVGAQLAAPAQAALREAVAQRRIRLMLPGEKNLPAADAAALLAKIKDASPSQHRRLLEGRLEDDDLVLLLKKVRQPVATQKEPSSAKPKVLTAADIVSEFSRHNQAGSALLRLHAYTVEGRLKTADGKVQQLLLFKMRPDFFRLVVLEDGRTRYILAGNGERFWQQGPGGPPQVVPASAIGTRRYLAEFADPLLVGEDYHFEKLADGEVDGKKTYRISVQRADGSHFVADIDQEKFQEIAREDADKSITRYSDFRDVAGVTYAFREEAADAAGHKGGLDLVRITPNPGLIPAFFLPPTEHELGYFEIERLVAQAPAKQ